MSSPALRAIACGLLATAAAAATALASAAEPTPHWGYEQTISPQHWSELAPACAGRMQSPIDLHPGNSTQAAPHTLHADYPPMRFEVVNNGHTVQAMPLPGEQGGVLIDGERYRLLQFHVHTPSEHRVEGRAHDMELHLVHASDSGRTAVVAVFFDVGAANAALDELFAGLPQQLNAAGTRLTLQRPLQLATLLPADPAGLRYNGSLTTPPCTEGVLWNIEPVPQSLSAQQLAALRTLYPHNNRPLQAANGRQVDAESID